MLSSFRALKWDAEASADEKPSVFHYCKVLEPVANADENDEALGRGQDLALYLKWGQEALGNDDQLTRAYLSTNSRRPVRAPVGLGVYNHNALQTTQASMNVGVNEFEPEADDQKLSYRIWVRLT